MSLTIYIAIFALRKIVSDSSLFLSEFRLFIPQQRSNILPSLIKEEPVEEYSISPCYVILPPE